MPKMNQEKEVWTIGHSNRPLEELIEMLQSFNIEQLVDIRHYPGSRKYPYFNKENLEKVIPENGIGYLHMVDLGGRRKVNKDSKNIAWRHPAFRGYADYMETVEFKTGIEKLEEIAQEKRTAYMCSEAVWWRCHRSMVSDYLKAHGWKVMHIMNIGVAKEHPYTGAASIVDGTLRYDIVKEEKK